MSGQLREERLQPRLERAIARLVHRHVGDDAGASDQRRAELLQPGQHAGPVALHLLGQPPQEEELADAVERLFDGESGVQVGAQPGVGQHVAGRRQLRLGPRLGLQHHLAEALLVVQPHGRQHVAQDVEHGRGLGGGGLAAQDEVGDKRPTIRFQVPGSRFQGRAFFPWPLAPSPWPLSYRCHERCRMNAPRRPPNALRQAHEVLGLRAHLQQRLAKEGSERQQAGRQAAQVEAQVEVDDAVGEQVVGQHARAG